jgi:hypothetical protein
MATKAKKLNASALLMTVSFPGFVELTLHVDAKHQGVTLMTRHMNDAMIGATSYPWVAQLLRVSYWEKEEVQASTMQVQQVPV